MYLLTCARHRAARAVGVGPTRRSRPRVRGFGGDKRADGRAVHLDGEVRASRRSRREAGRGVSTAESSRNNFAVEACVCMYLLRVCPSLVEAEENAMPLRMISSFFFLSRENMMPLRTKKRRACALRTNDKGQEEERRLHPRLDNALAKNRQPSDVAFASHRHRLRVGDILIRGPRPHE